MDLEAVLAAMSGAGIMLPSQSATNLPRLPAAATQVCGGSRLSLGSDCRDGNDAVSRRGCRFLHVGLARATVATKDAINAGANKTATLAAVDHASDR